ncbi:MAG: P1 family peptidase [Clostridia bacterium]|nr:P1 family peptidase [Clostridia bacterium]
MYEGSITDVNGLLIGHAQDTQGLSGVTVLLAREGAVTGVSVSGSAPGTRETALMEQAKAKELIYAVLLAGGSAYGLAAADGVMLFCEQNGMGVHTPAGVVPTVPAAVIYDLEYGRSDVRPNAGMGYAACINAKQTVQQGSIGAGIGATVGKVLGMKHCQKGGIGTASLTLAGGAVVGAIVCVNAFGDIYDNGRIIAGARTKQGFLDTAEYMITHEVSTNVFRDRNTTLGIVATDAVLDRDEATKLAQVAQDGMARAINPVHTMVDGDTVFGLSYGSRHADLNCILAAAAEATRRAIVNAELAVGAAVM